MESKAFLAVLASVLFILPLVSAADSSLTITPDRAQTYGGVPKTFILTIMNNQTFDETYSVSIIGPKIWDWLTIEKNQIFVSAGGSASTVMTLSPPIGIDQQTYGYTIKVTSSKDTVTSKDFLLTVIHRWPIVFSDFSLDSSSYQPEQNVKMFMTIENMADYKLTDYTVQLVITREDKVVGGTTVNVGLDALQTQSFTKSFPIDMTMSLGRYNITAVLRSPANVEITRWDKFFDVVGKPKVIQQRSEYPSILYKEVKITVTNQGNTPADLVTVSEQLEKPWSWFIAADVAVDEKLSGDKDTFKWNIANLAPGTSTVISYKILYWPIDLIVIAILFGLVYYFIEAQKPSIKKRVTPGATEIGREFTITLEVKNKSRRTIRNVIVRDWVPPVLKVTRHYESLKAEEKKTDLGHELVWKLGDMKPDDERLINYKVSAIVGVAGTLKLPRAYIRYKDEKGNSLRVLSQYTNVGEKEFR